MEKDKVEEMDESGIPTKPTETEAQPATAQNDDKPVDDKDDVTEEDISNVIATLNEFQKIIGGKEQIANIPKELVKINKFMIEKMIALRDMYEDPYWKQMIDDMVDQKEDGKTPSVVVAAARVIPQDEYEEAVDNENYDDVQAKVGQKVQGIKDAQDNEASMASNFKASQDAGKAYCQKMNYDDSEMKDLFSLAMSWFKILGDGMISEEEWAKIDKMRNYDGDTKMLRDQLPAAPTKEVLPDKSSMQASMNAPAPTKPAAKPTNSLEALGMAQSTPSYIRPRGGAKV